MIDTVRFKLFASPFKSTPFGWEVKEGTWISDIDGEVISWKQCQHKETGLRLYGTEGMAQSLEVSLPKVMHGCNGILLRLKEINTAYRAALDLATEAVMRPDPESITRYDLVLHFHGPACDYLASLRGLKHKKVRNRCCEFFGSGLEWPGRYVHIRLYDKKLELEGSPGMVQRLEFQLRGSSMRDVWSSRSGFDPESCYKQYRDLCDGFASRSVPRFGSVNDLLAFLLKNEVVVNGVDPVERYLACRSNRQRYRINKDLNSVRLDYFSANFTDNLPEDPTLLTYLDCITEPAARAPLAGDAAA